MLVSYTATAEILTEQPLELADEVCELLGAYHVAVGLGGTLQDPRPMLEVVVSLPACSPEEARAKVAGLLDCELGLRADTMTVVCHQD